jgi:hypothetical protein
MVVFVEDFPQKSSKRIESRLEASAYSSHGMQASLQSGLLSSQKKFGVPGQDLLLFDRPDSPTVESANKFDKLKAKFGAIRKLE